MDKFAAWSDGDVERVYGLDGPCANLTLYWATRTIGSFVRFYAETFADQAMQAPPERGSLLVGVTVFPRDILRAPRT